MWSFAYAKMCANAALLAHSPPNGTAEQHVREIGLQTCKKYLAEEKIRIVISGLRGALSIAGRRLDGSGTECRTQSGVR